MCRCVWCCHCFHTGVWWSFCVQVWCFHTGVWQSFCMQVCFMCCHCFHTGVWQSFCVHVCFMCCHCFHTGMCGDWFTCRCVQCMSPVSAWWSLITRHRLVHISLWMSDRLRVPLSDVTAVIYIIILCYWALYPTNVIMKQCHNVVLPSLCRKLATDNFFSALKPVQIGLWRPTCTAYISTYSRLDTSRHCRDDGCWLLWSTTPLWLTVLSSSQVLIFFVTHGLCQWSKKDSRGGGAHTIWHPVTRNELIFWWPF